MNKILVLNHKSNFTIKETKEYIENIPNTKAIQIIICPSLIHIPYYKNHNKYNLGIQNIELKNITGEINIQQLKDSNIEYVLIGHSERKNNYFESDKETNLKIKTVLQNNLTPIICLGETKEQKNNNQTKETIIKQLNTYLKDIKPSPNTIIAYEPIWAIGSGQYPEIQEIEDIIISIKNEIKKQFNQDIKVIYGGSITQENIQTLNNIQSIDGFLLGSSSLNINAVKNIINKLEEKQ